MSNARDNQAPRAGDTSGEPSGSPGSSSEMLQIPVVVLPHGRGLGLPVRATPGSAGFDLCAALESPLILLPGARTLIPTGLRLAIPAGWEGEVRPRSGLALRHGVTLPNAPGTIDADYRGELLVPLINHGEAPVTVERGARIAQILFRRVPAVHLVEVAELPEGPDRGGGFGSTGT